jgi:hypothetical protein
MSHLNPAQRTPVVHRYLELNVPLPPNSREWPKQKGPKMIAYGHLDHMMSKPTPAPPIVCRPFELLGFATVPLPPDSREWPKQKGLKTIAQRTPTVRRYFKLNVPLPPNSQEWPKQKGPKTIAYWYLDHTRIEPTPATPFVCRPFELSGFATVPLPSDSRDLAERMGLIGDLPLPISPVPFAGFQTSMEHLFLTQEITPTASPGLLSIRTCTSMDRTSTTSGVKRCREYRKTHQEYRGSPQRNKLR